jgi:PAS domain S-box-containing protein
MTNKTKKDGSDTTSRREKELLERIERYELASRATNDVLYELNLETGIVTWNDALHTQYGYTGDENTATEEWWVQHVHPDDALRLEHEWSAWFDSSEDIWQSEYRFQKADGSYIDVRDRGLLQRADDGMPVRIIGSMLDITKQKQLDQSKDEFIALMSHQLRTPLTSINIYSEMLTEGMLGPLSGKQKRQIAHTIDSSMRLIKIIGDILDVSRVEFSKIFTRQEKTDINHFLNNHVNELQPIAAEKGVIIHFAPDQKIGEIDIDIGIFGLIMHNLLTNAIQYTKPHRGSVELAFARSREGYLLSIKDNGIGIPANEKEHIFERHYRTVNAAKFREHGTGVGLYIVKQLSDVSGYEIWFESRLDKGTTFYVYLPDMAKLQGV